MRAVVECLETAQQIEAHGNVVDGRLEFEPQPRDQGRQAGHCGGVDLPLQLDEALGQLLDLGAVSRQQHLAQRHAVDAIEDDATSAVHGDSSVRPGDGQPCVCQEVEHLGFEGRQSRPFRSVELEHTTIAIREDLGITPFGQEVHRRPAYSTLAAGSLSVRR